MNEKGSITIITALLFAIGFATGALVVWQWWVTPRGWTSFDTTINGAMPVIYIALGVCLLVAQVTCSPCLYLSFLVMNALSLFFILFIFVYGPLAVLATILQHHLFIADNAQAKAQNVAIILTTTRALNRRVFVIPLVVSIAYYSLLFALQLFFQSVICRAWHHTQDWNNENDEERDAIDV